jgi:hypothetical protein
MKHRVTKLRAAAGKVLDASMLDHSNETQRLRIFRRKDPA